MKIFKMHSAITYTYKLKAACWFVIMWIFNQHLYSQTYYNSVTSTAASFLRIPGDITQAGMGNTGLATGSNEYSSLVNIAKIPSADANKSFSASYSPWLNNFGAKSAFLSNISFFNNIDDQQAIAFNVRYFSLGNIQLADAQGNALGIYKPYEMAAEGSYIRKVTDQITLGSTFKFVHSALINGSIDNITYHAANAVAADIAFLYNGEDQNEGDQNSEGFSAGVVLSNLGSKLRYSGDAASQSFLPANLGIGVAYKIAPEDDEYILFALDINKELVPAIPPATNNYTTDSSALGKYTQQSVFGSWISSFSDGSNQLKDLRIGIGAEFGFRQIFYARFGYFFEDKNYGNTRYFTFGLGLKYKGGGIDFAYVVPTANTGTTLTESPFQNVLRFGLVFKIANNNN